MNMTLMEKLASDGDPIRRSLFLVAFSLPLYNIKLFCQFLVWKNVHKKLAAQKINFIVAKLPSLPSPEELCSPLTLCFSLFTIYFTSECIHFHHPPLVLSLPFSIFSTNKASESSL